MISRLEFRDDASDEYIDQVLEAVRQLVIDEGLDPASLPEEEVSFSETILGITFHGSAKLYDGFFKGLSTIKRTGDTSLGFDEASNKLKLTAKVGVTDMKAGYSARVEFQGIGVGASADADISKLNIYFEADADLQDGVALKLSKFDIQEIGGISVHFHGLGPLDYVLDLLVDAVANLLKNVIAGLVEGPLKDVIQKILDSILPF